MPAYVKAMIPVLCAAAAAIAGCGQVGERTHHYVIDPIESRELVRPVSAQEGMIVAVSPVVLPEYLNQSGIVTKDHGSEIIRSETHLWAGPLSEEMARAVTENLSAMLGTDRVLLGTARRSLPVDYIVDIEVVSFERRADGNAVDMIARWAVFRGDERSLVAMRRARLSTPVSGSDYADTVAAMSRSVRALSEEIAVGIGQTRNRGRQDRWAAERRGGTLSGDAPGRTQTGRR